MPLAVAWVADPLVAGESARWRRYDWSADRFAEWHETPWAPVVVLEGCGAGSAALRPFTSTAVWVETPAAQREERLRARRDWTRYAPHRTRWVAQEEALFSAERPWEHADVVVDNLAEIRAGRAESSGGRRPGGSAPGVARAPQPERCRTPRPPHERSVPSTPRSGQVSRDRPRLSRDQRPARAWWRSPVKPRRPGSGARRRLFRDRTGGSPANVALGLARLGVPARLLARIADDMLGKRIREHLTHNGVQLDHAVAADEQTSLAMVSLDADGSPAYDFRINGTADWQWTADEVAGALDPGASGPVVALHSGSLALTTPPGDSVLRDLMARSAETVTISYDPNCRPMLMGDPEVVRQGVHELLTVADVVKVSSEDLGWLVPEMKPEQVVDDWLSRGPTVVAVTSGRTA